MRVLEVTQRYPPALGGVERHVEQLTRELRRARFEVDVLTTDLARDRPFTRLGDASRDPRVRAERVRAVRIADLPHGLGIVAPGLVLETVRRSADVVHAHAFGFPPTWAGALRRWGKATPLVVTPHSDTGGGGWGSQLYERAFTHGVLTRADHVVALTEGERARLERLGVEPARLSVLPNGIDLTEFKDLDTSARGSETFRVLYVGRIDPQQKGLTTLIRAVASLEEGRRIAVRLVGEDWGGTAEVVRLIGALRVGDRVEVVGPVSRPQLLSEYAATDLFVLPSTIEPFGIVLLEAMAAGLPIVATSVGGIPEVVDHGRTGLLVPPKDPRKLAEAIEKFRGDADLRQRFGRAGLARVAAFSWERLGPRYARMFETIASVGPRAPASRDG